MRLGEILLHAGVIDAEQLAAAFRQQVVYGGRLGTNLIELGYADPDQIARALARQHRVPAALRRHVSRHDPAVLGLVPRELAASTMAVPIAFSMADGKRLVACMRDPGDSMSLETLAEAAGLEVVACVAAELVVAALLERCYRIPRPRRMAHAAHGATTPLPTDRGSGPIAVPSLDAADDSIDVDFDADDVTPMPAELQLVDLDDDNVARDMSQYSTPHGRVHEIAGSLWASASAMEGLELAAVAQAGIDQALAAAAAVTTVPPDLSGAEPSTAPAPAVASAPPPATATLTEALAALEEARDRDAVDDAVLAFMHGAFDGGMILLARDGLALGSRGFGGLFDDVSVQSVVIPLSVPSVFARAHDQRTTFKGAAPVEGAAIHERFFRLFDLATAPPMVAVAPVCIRDRVVCLYYAHGANVAHVGGLEQLASAVSRTFVRLIRAGKQSSS